MITSFVGICSLTHSTFVFLLQEHGSSMIASSSWIAVIHPLPRLPQLICLLSLVWRAKMSWERTRRMKPITASTSMTTSLQTVCIRMWFWHAPCCYHICVAHICNFLRPVLFSRWRCPVRNGHLTDGNCTRRSKRPGITHARGLLVETNVVSPHGSHL